MTNRSDKYDSDIAAASWRDAAQVVDIRANHERYTMERKQTSSRQDGDGDDVQ